MALPWAALLPAAEAGGGPGTIPSATKAADIAFDSVFDTPEEIKAMPPCRATVVKRGPCYVYLRTAEGKGFYLGSPGSQIEVGRFLDLVEEGQTCDLPKKFLVYQQALQTAGRTNHFSIHLQEGFEQGHEAVITVEGREVYRDRAKTNPVLGFAKSIFITVTSHFPAIAFALPAKNLRWEKRIDLTAGPALGISVTPEGRLNTRQARAFACD